MKPSNLKAYNKCFYFAKHKKLSRLFFVLLSFSERDIEPPNLLCLLIYQRAYRYHCKKNKWEQENVRIQIHAWVSNKVQRNNHT